MPVGTRLHFVRLNLVDFRPPKLRSGKSDAVLFAEVAVIPISVDGVSQNGFRPVAGPLPVLRRTLYERNALVKIVKALIIDERKAVYYGQVQLLPKLYWVI